MLRERVHHKHSLAYHSTEDVFQMTKRPALDKHVRTFPDLIPPITKSLDENMLMFGTALELWQGGYNPTLLKGVVTSPDIATDNCLIEHIRDTRKRGMLLNSAYKYFADPHTSPDFHFSLVRRLGKFYDSLGGVEQPLQTEKLIAAVDVYPKVDAHASVTISHPQDTHEYLRQTGSMIRTSLLLEDGVTKDEVHKLKMISRGVLQIYHLRLMTFGEPEVDAIYPGLKLINSRLRDFVEGLDRTDKTTKYIIPEHPKALLQDFWQKVTA